MMWTRHKSRVAMVVSDFTIDGREECLREDGGRFGGGWFGRKDGGWNGGRGKVRK